MLKRLLKRLKGRKLVTRGLAVELYPQRKTNGSQNRPASCA